MEHFDYHFAFEEWVREESAKDRKQYSIFIGERPYRHFDGAVSLGSLDTGESRLTPLMKEPQRLSRHPFLPFLRRDRKTRHYTKKAIEQKKPRPIMYASHRDATILAFYAFILKTGYEARIKGTALAQAVVAYRKIPRVDQPKKGKANIDLAKDVQELTRQHKQCAVLCLDIENFFGSMDHALIKQRWMKSINVDKLPPGHYAVFRNVTSYRYVFLHEALETLGYGRLVRGKFRYRKGKLRRGILCSPDAYDKKINPKTRSLVHKNLSGRGIPQGSPISHMIANIYLESFDQDVIEELAKYQFAHYRRYSDDILIVCPEKDAKSIYGFVVSRIKAEKLTIKEKKTEVVVLDHQLMTAKDISYSVTNQASREMSKRQTFQYLGFEIDTNDIHLRSGTIAAHYRRAIRRAATNRRAAARGGSLHVAQKKDSKRTDVKRGNHWQYLMISKKRLASRRLNQQVKKVVRRAKSF